MKLIHVVPLVPCDDMAHADADHEKRRVHAPDDDCFLCREGICTQVRDRDAPNVIVHGTGRPN